MDILNLIEKSEILLCQTHIAVFSSHLDVKKENQQVHTK